MSFFLNERRFLALLIWLSLLTGTQAQLARVANTSLTNLPTVPPQFGYAVNTAFPGLTVSQPVCLKTPPGETNRLFILEKTGAMVVMTNLANPTRTVFMTLGVLTDSESGLLGLAFHPGYATNRFFYLFSTRQMTTAQGTGRHQVISRFQTTATNASVALTNSELILIAQRDSAGNHNGGDLHFGSDGYLYASVGDEGPQYNGALHAQIITNKFFSAILRLDVDKRSGNLLPNPHPANSTNYFVPADNPYVGVTNFNGNNFAATNVRTEFYSIGYRNPWRFCFDPLTDFLYVADVGQDRFEEVSVVPKGGNAGWAYYEGNQLAKPLYPTQSTILTNPPAGLIFPIQDYPHAGGTTGGNSITGGLVYRGNRISQLYGAYVFADYSSGNVWQLRYDGSNTVPYQNLLTIAGGPSSFGTDPRNGDILIALVDNSSIVRLDYSASVTGTPLPATLAATGAFTNLTTLAPAPGIVPYEVNVPFWSDNAAKFRWFSVPRTNLTIGFNTNANWLFPTSTVWIKHFEIELTNGSPASRKRLETRFTIRNTNGIYGITYRWDSATNATLVPEAGTNEILVINDAGILRTQIWRYPSRAECLACHTPAGGLALGFNTPQLNRNQTYGALTTNQLSALAAAGYFSTALTNSPGTLFALAHPTNTTASLDFRARSFLAANCVQCHQPGGPQGRANWDARISTPTALAGLLNAVPVNDLGNTNNALVKFQSPSNSVLLARLRVRDANATPSIQMPPLGSNLTNAEAIQLITEWISARPTFNAVSRTGTNFILRGDSGWPGQPYRLRTSTNLLVTRTNWTISGSNTFDAQGTFIITNPISPAARELFHLLETP